MQKLISLCCVLGAVHSPVTAQDFSPLYHQLTLSLERSAWDGVTLGNDQSEDRLLEKEYEFEIALDYQVNDALYLFFTGTLTDDREIVETAGTEEKTQSLERTEMGIGYVFGEKLVSDLNVGRMEFMSASEWWIWWDEELDAARIQSKYGALDSMLAIAEEQAPENTDDDFIDPELDGVRRQFLSLAWELANGQSLILYYLDQEDTSKSFRTGETEKFDRVDESDADLTWTGISYLADFDFGSAGELTIELHAARVSGNEALYEFGDAESGRAEVEEVEQRDVEGSAHSMLVGWTPVQLDNLTLVLGRAQGDGDADPDDGRDRSFRQTGLQGESESFGDFYQPELSNLTVDVIGFAWEVGDGLELALLNFSYQQREPSVEMRDVTIENDITGASRDLGRETDLVLTIGAREGLEMIVTLAEFKAGRAYGEFSKETSNFIKFELDYSF